MPVVFENPTYLRAKIHDMETRQDSAKLHDRWAYIGADFHIYTHPTEQGAAKQAAKLFTLYADYDTCVREVSSTDEAVLRIMGEAHHNAATIKPDLTLKDPTGKTIATMDAWAIGWKEAVQ